MASPLAGQRVTVLVNRIDAAKRAIYELAKTMETAYGIRVVADYEPLEEVEFNPEYRFSLRSVGITDAHDWESKTRLLCQAVRNTWNEIHV